MRRFVGMAYRFVRYPNRMERLARRWRIFTGAEVVSAPAAMPVPNEILLRDELLSYTIVPKSYPTTLFLDPATMCNLACPFCPTGNGSSGIKKDMLKPETFEKIVAHLNLDALRHVNLYNWGEPLLNKHFPDFVRFFHDRGKTTSTSVNFSAKDYSDAEMEAVVKCGLDIIHVSIDGATQEVYAKYRVRGDLNRVIENMRRLNEAKIRLGSQTPIMYYKLLLNKFNESQLERAKEIAAEVGAEFLLHENFWVPEDLRDEWVADSYREKYGSLPVTSILSTEGMERRGTEIHTECRQLWDSVLVNVNGDVYPCCIIQQAEHRIGNLVDQHFDEIWNNEKMHYLRRYVTDSSVPAPDFPNHCARCTNRYCTHDVQVSVAGLPAAN